VVFASCTVLFLITIFILCGKKNQHGWPKCPFKPHLYPGMVEVANTYENGCNDLGTRVNASELGWSSITTVSMVKLNPK
jgi:hypothetical protein